MDVAALRLRDSILTSAETEGLTYQGYWLSTTLALGAFLKVEDKDLQHARLEHAWLTRSTFPSSDFMMAMDMVVAVA